MENDGLLGPIVAAVGLGIVGVSAVPTAKHFLPGLRRRRQHDGYEVVAGLYESRDGKATEESEREFSDREARVAAWITVGLGLAASVAAGLLLALNTPPASAWDGFNAWADVPAWTIIGLQCAAIPTTAQYDRRYLLSRLGLLSAASEFVSLTVRFGSGAVHTVAGRREDSLPLAVAACRLLELLMALAAGLAFAAFPHHPDVFSPQGLVDQQHASSLLTKFSYGWNPLVFVTSKQRKLEQDDLPNMDGSTRSSSVYDKYLAAKPTGRLWVQLLKTFKVPVAIQWALTLVQAVLALFPQYVLFHFLEGLETASGQKDRDPKLWGWVAGLSGSLILQTWVGNAQRWNTASRLEAPSLSLLQSLVFQKALRQDEAADPGQQSGDGKQQADDKDKKKPADTRQAVVNHIKMDTNRLNMFWMYNYWFPLAIFKLFLAGSYLTQLLGWQAVLAGLSSAVFIIPLSHFMSRKYAKIQFGLMSFRDAKTHLLTEALQGMRQIKYSALEDLYEKKILEARNAELQQYWKVTIWMCALNLVIFIGPLSLSCISLSVYAYMVDGRVKASAIFASLGLFDQLDEAIGLLPLLQVYLMEAWTSCVRLEKYFAQPDQTPVSTPGETISFHDATVRWPRAEDADENPPPLDETRSILRNVTLEFPNREMSVIAGKTGSGKSLLLAAILGEVKLMSGSIETPAAPPASVTNAEPASDAEWILPTLTSFVPQTPWIESGTLRDNVTFGLPHVDARYRKVLQACALEKDIELLVDGDQTEVGPKGVTLSGGQRWRVALARALYSRAGILIFDDVLSAVDAHVGRTIVTEALTGELAEGRTRIIATHHAEMCLPKAGYLVRLRNGRLESAEKITDASAVVISGVDEGSSTAASVSDATAVGAQEDAASEDADKKVKQPAATIPEEERETGRVKMHVYKTYVKATNSWALWALSFAVLISGRLLSVSTTWSLKKLTESYTTEGALYRFFHQSTASYPGLEDPVVHAKAAYRRSAAFWITAYVLLRITHVSNDIVARVVIFFIGFRAAKQLFERMTYTVLRTPLRWVDTVPTGRILNRFTQDTFTMDRRLALDLNMLLTGCLSLTVILATSISVSPWILPFGILLLVLYGRIAHTYISAARDVKRINAVAHSPIFDQFSSVLSGLSTIRAFKRTDFYMDRMFRLIDNGAKSTWALQLLSRWMSFRLSMLGVVFVTIVAISILFGGADASLAGFALFFALRYTGSLTMLLSLITSVELGFNAAERILEFIETDMEPQDGDDVPAAWPSEGKIEVKNVTVGYAETLPDVLKDISFEAKPGERIGIVGRTGAGKSTLAAMLFRLLELRQGSVHIDGVDTSKVKLKQLRSRLAIIPQDPFLFSGTLRSNLDLEGKIDDYDLQIVLRRVHLVDPETGDPERPSAYPPVDQTVAALPPPETAAPTESTPLLLSPQDLPAGAAGALPITPLGASPQVPGTPAEPTGAGAAASADQQEATYATAFTNLSTPISTGGGNLSQGQRQLVCLARALLSRPKIVLLDEATSAVDRGTDGAIQESLRREFAAGGCTVLVIAHRLSTVADFDRLLVLKEGRVAEFGTPAELLRNGMARDEEGKLAERAEDDGTGAFWELVQRSAERERLIDMILGEKKQAVDTAEDEGAARDA